MCVIAVAIKNKIDPDDIIKCHSTNPHGIGMAWRENNVVKWKKGLSLKETKDLSQSLPLPYIIHFRWATVGGVKNDLIHPFIISKDSPLKLEGQNERLLFHNGHFYDHDLLTDILDLKLDGPVSDSRILASTISQFGNNILEKLGKKNNRFVVFSNDHLKLISEDWTSYHGCMFSNLNWVKENYRRAEPSKMRFSNKKKQSKHHEVYEGGWFSTNKFEMEDLNDRLTVPQYTYDPNLNCFRCI